LKIRFEGLYLTTSALLGVIIACKKAEISTLWGKGADFIIIIIIIIVVVVGPPVLWTPLHVPDMLPFAYAYFDKHEGRIIV